MTNGTAKYKVIDVPESGDPYNLTNSSDCVTEVSKKRLLSFCGGQLKCFLYLWRWTRTASLLKNVLSITVLFSNNCWGFSYLHKQQKGNVIHAEDETVGGRWVQFVWHQSCPILSHCHGPLSTYYVQLTNHTPFKLFTLLTVGIVFLVNAKLISLLDHGTVVYE